MTKIETPRALESPIDVAKQAASIRRKAVGYSLLGAASLLLVWVLVQWFIRNENFEYLPSPWRVANRMWGFIVGDASRNVDPGKVFANFWETLRKMLYGWSGAVVAGIIIGILMGRYRYARNYFFYFVYAAGNIPLIVYSIIAVLMFGIGDTGPAVVVGISVVPGIAINVAAGVEGVDRNLLAMSRAYRRPTGSAVRHIVFPSFISYLFAAARNSFASSWKLGALAEAFGGATGVGVQLRKSFAVFSVADLLAWMMFFVIFIILTERVVLMRLERYVFRYRLKRGEDVLRY
ncbi:MAG: putative nitrate/sulfonate/bicarbonate transporter inner rane protein [Gemmatimonadetes bacterium]|nr:putative nitrate/sulfonate/bicarbonate transporter inner rane protein [Gemmatimonadota bacterium]